MSSFVEQGEKDIVHKSAAKHDRNIAQPSKEEAEQSYIDEENDRLDEDARDAYNGAELETVASSKPSVNNIRSVPNGGLTAWLQVLGSFFLFFNTWGTVNTFVSTSEPFIVEERYIYIY